jgi:hypothetical protein
MVKSIVTIPNLLFDVNFNDNSFDVDYTKDGRYLVFEPDDRVRVTPNDGFVTVTANRYFKLATGLPAYIKHTGDQSWVVNFRTDTTNSTRFIVHTAPVGPDPTTSVLNTHMIFHVCI